MRSKPVINHNQSRYRQTSGKVETTPLLNYTSVSLACEVFFKSRGMNTGSIDRQIINKKQDDNTKD